MGGLSINEPQRSREVMLMPLSHNEPQQALEALPELPPVEPPVEPPVDIPNPSLNSINPNTAKQDAGQVAFNATGTRFYEGSKISFGGAFIPTVFVNEGKLTGTVDVSALVIGSFLVHVDNEGSLSTNKTFTVTDPSVEAEAEVDPDELEEEIEEAEDEGEFTALHVSKATVVKKSKKTKR